MVRRRFVFSKSKNIVPWAYVVSDVNGEEITGSFYEKELQKPSQKKFRIEKLLKRKGDKLYVKWKRYDNGFNIRIDKKDLISFKQRIKMSQYFPKPFGSFEGNIKVKVGLSNYATKTDLENVKHVNTSSFGLKANLANLKTEVDKLEIDKLAPVPLDLSKLSDVVKIDFAKKTVYDKLVSKVNNIDTNDVALKTKYNTDKTELEKQISSVTDFVKEAKLTELENKIPDISNLATKTALTTVENKIRVINLV